MKREEEWVDYLRTRLGDWPFRGPDPIHTCQVVDVRSRLLQENECESGDEEPRKQESDGR